MFYEILLFMTNPGIFKDSYEKRLEIASARLPKNTETRWFTFLLKKDLQSFEPLKKGHSVQMVGLLEQAAKIQDPLACKLVTDLIMRPGDHSLLSRMRSPLPEAELCGEILHARLRMTARSDERSVLYAALASISPREFVRAAEGKERSEIVPMIASVRLYAPHAIESLKASSHYDIRVAAQKADPMADSLFHTLSSKALALWEAIAKLPPRSLTEILIVEPTAMGKIVFTATLSPEPNRAKHALEFLVERSFGSRKQP